MALHWGRRPTSVTLRRNFGRIRIVGVVVLVFPQVFKGWNDFTNMQIDNFPKFSYPLVLTLADDLNFRLAVRQLDIYGEHTNGSFNGLAGMLQRGEAEIGATSMFMREDRSHVMHFCAETVILRGVFLFRQPSQSAVSNIFLLPFSRGVWACSMAVFALSGLFVAALGRPLAPVDSTLEAITPGEAVTFTVGAICQQGFYLSPNLASMRIAMLFTLVTSVFAFTSYSAKIVAILQTPSDAIQTTADLAKSSIACGSQDTTYRKTYFEESVDPAVQHLYKHKMLPYGDRAYLSVVDGVERLRTEFFAYQVEQAAGYDVITKTFTEQEKCMLTEIEAFRLPTVAVPIKKNSGFRDIFGTRFRWQREVGLMDRSARRWFAKKPRCEQGSSSFVTVGLTDCLPAVQVLAYGMLASILVLIGEIFTRKFQVKRGQRKMLHHNTSTCLIS
uniref:Putative ionotropic receptor 2 n=1 Tax=Conopomorpha sinensis TaxID=940481 RepID=A0A3Q8HDV1_9NEOP|nr:putative ionotropic receptor 2 [Conopomorpha sinensis]